MRDLKAGAQGGNGVAELAVRRWQCSVSSADRRVLRLTASPIVLASRDPQEPFASAWRKGIQGLGEHLLQLSASE